jgi:hypothetical protein
MKLKRSTVVLVGVALLMGAGVLIAESQRGRTPPTAAVEGTGEPIFPFEESAVTRLQVERDGETLVFEKDDEGKWQMVEPDTSPAEPGALAYLLSRLNTDSPLQTVAMQPDEVEEFGFSDPAGTITVTLEDGTEHWLLLGGEDFSGSARYAVIDPEIWPLAANGTEEISVLVVSQDVANGINRPLDEWKMPLEAATDEEETTETGEDTTTEIAEDAAASEAVDSPEALETREETEATRDTASPEATEATPEAQPEPAASPEASEPSPESEDTEPKAAPE